MEQSQNTHSIVLGYLLWIFGFIGAHRFYYGKQVTGRDLVFYPWAVLHWMDHRSISDSIDGARSGAAVLFPGPSIIT